MQEEVATDLLTLACNASLGEGLQIGAMLRDSLRNY